MYFEYGADLGKEGADLLVTASAWPAMAGGEYERAAVQNASKCNCWHVVSDQTGKVGYATDYGHSSIIDPNGKVIAEKKTEDRNADLLFEMPAGELQIILQEALEDCGAMFTIRNSDAFHPTPPQPTYRMS
jgi:predicted amidohydrolase